MALSSIFYSSIEPSATKQNTHVVYFVGDPITIHAPSCHFFKDDENNSNILQISDDVDTLVDWFTNVTSLSVDILYKNKDNWFQGDITREDIEGLFKPSFSITNQGQGQDHKKYMSVEINDAVDTAEKEKDDCHCTLLIKGINITPTHFSLIVYIETIVDYPIRVKTNDGSCVPVQFDMSNIDIEEETSSATIKTPLEIYTKYVELYRKSLLDVEYYFDKLQQIKQNYSLPESMIRDL